MLVDTPVWSEFFRRSTPKVEVRDEFRALVEASDAVLIGPIRQEILSGVKEHNQFELLKTALGAFPDERLEREDYEQAASMFNQCHARGVQGSNVDFLICAVSLRHSAPIFTLDRDFNSYAEILPIRLYART